MIPFGLQRRFAFQGCLQRLLRGEQCRGKAVHAGDMLLQRFRARLVFRGPVLGRANRSYRCFQSRSDGGCLPFLLPQRRLQGFGFFPGPVDFRMRAILDGPHMRRLGLAFSRHDTLVRVEGLGELLCTLLPPIALVRELSQLAGLLLDETLDIRQSRFSHLTGLIRALRLRLGFGDRDVPELAFLRERRLSDQQGVLLVHEGGLSQLSTSSLFDGQTGCLDRIG